MTSFYLTANRFLIVILFSFPISGFASTPATPGDGFVLTHWGQWSHSEGVAALDQAVSVGARHVSMLVMLCQETQRTSSVRWCDSEPGTPLSRSFQGERLLRLLPELRTRGLAVSLIPFPWVEDRMPRAGIWPEQRQHWFASYAEHMEQLAVFASENEIEELVIASELTRLFWLEAPWRDLIRRLRPIFSGHLTLSPVAVQHPFIRFWDELDSIGVSAYFPLSIHKKIHGQRLLNAAWHAHKAHLKTLARSHRKPLTFVEVGYPTTDVAAVMPWDYQWDKRTHEETIAARCWEAFRLAWGGETVLRSFRIWGLSAQKETPKAFTPMGKKAEDPVRALFGERDALFR